MADRSQPMRTKCPACGSTELELIDDFESPCVPRYRCECAFEWQVAAEAEPALG